MGPRIVKLGGSLLGLTDLQSRLRNWLERNPHPRTLLVIGGGKLIDAIRCYDDRHALDPAFAHWLCIDLLEASSALVEHMFPEFASLQTESQITDFVVCRPAPAVPTGVAHVRAFYHAALADPRLPKNWNTTTDSLAALLAVQVGASELILLKSADPPANCQTADQLVAAGLVDSTFPRIAAPLDFSLVNLRTADV